MRTIKVELTTFEDMLGLANANPDVHDEYIASKAPSEDKSREEVEAVSVAEQIEKSTTVFPRDENGKPILFDYQIKGMFKDACGVLRKVTGTKSSQMKAYKKDIDGLIFVMERRIPIEYEGEITTCQRPLRASTPQGERIALASSESIPAGAKVRFTVLCMRDSDIETVKEWLDYGQYRGLGQWRNSGKGRFTGLRLHDSRGKRVERTREGSEKNSADRDQRGMQTNGNAQNRTKSIDTEMSRRASEWLRQETMREGIAKSSDGLERQ